MRGIDKLVVGVMVGSVGVAWLISTSVMSSTSFKCRDAAIYAAIKDEVRTHLKSPSSAKFRLDFDEIARRIPPHSIKAYAISGYVESQNAFGAMLKSSFSGNAYCENGDMDVTIVFLGD